MFGDVLTVVEEYMIAICWVSYVLVQFANCWTHLAESAKQIATPKKNVDQTRMSGQLALSYRLYTLVKSHTGSAKNSMEPMRCDQIFTGRRISKVLTLRVGMLTHFVVDVFYTSQRLPI